MYLHSLKIKGFRKISNAEIIFSPNTTFLIGANNAGKSSVFAALKLFLSANKTTAEDDFCRENSECLPSDIIELEGEFRGVNPEVISNPSWKGFNARRVLKYAKDDGTYDYRIFYKREFHRGGSSTFYMREFSAVPKQEFANARTWRNLIENGLDRSLIHVEDDKLDDPIYKTTRNSVKNPVDELYDMDAFWNIDIDSEDNLDWKENPGGFASNVISKLPKILLIPPHDDIDEYGEKKGTLYDLLNEIFDEIKSVSDNYRNAQHYLSLLANEFSSTDSSSPLRELIGNLNSVIGGVFPGAKLEATTTFDYDNALTPKYNIRLGSNISTKPEYQGTGQVRAAVFGLLKYKESHDKEKGRTEKDLIIAFEEPELYLHPHAAYLMKEVIYKLSDNNQIVCSTHSPYMIDLSKEKSQVLNKLAIIKTENTETTVSQAFNISPEYISLVGDDKDYVKMLLKLDAEVAKIFFGKKILIVEGDTEEIVLKQVINLLDEEVRNKIIADWTILKARGKPVIISILRYLHAMDFQDIKVMHDADMGTDGAERFNNLIKYELGNDDNLFVLANCIEDALGCTSTGSNKPFNAYKQTLNWNNYDDIPEVFKNVCSRIFEI
ncbi:MAG: AAA family ATPase [Alphaproteobacteria bacterium]|nr:AAA family ATPase [Alphaproteobacteria bacterium]